MVRGVHGTETPIEEERLVMRRVFLMEDHVHRLFGEVLSQVVAVLRTSRRIDVVVVTHQIRGPVVRVALEESVVALKSEAKWPSIKWSRWGSLSSRSEVPFPTARVLYPASRMTRGRVADDFGSSTEYPG
jgi:hypothetical protein